MEKPHPPAFYTSSLTSPSGVEEFYFMVISDILVKLVTLEKQSFDLGKGIILKCNSKTRCPCGEPAPAKLGRSSDLGRLRIRRLVLVIQNRAANNPRQIKLAHSSSTFISIAGDKVQAVDIDFGTYYAV